MRRYLHALAALSMVISLVWTFSARAANVTLTPIVPPTETGEDGLSSQQVKSVARFKPGMGTASAAVASSAAAVTINNAAGIISLTSATAGASGATPTVVTVTDNKVQTTDTVLCAIDQTGATAGAVLTCIPHITAAGTFTISVYDASVTALAASSITVSFMILTSGNPN